ncbi:MAG: hypothetical protein WC743_25400 [Mucilaginibacter sp.]|jgi:hypothetical protein
MDIKKNLITPALYFLLLMAIFQTADAQGNLTKLINIAEGKPQRIGTLLDKIASKGNFSFAYNNTTVPADSLVSVSGYSGTVFSILEKILGNTYEYQEVPGYVVLRYAPGSLYITADMERGQGNQILIRGYVHNVINDKGIPRASVFEKNLLVSTLTDDRGYFELRVKNWNGPLLINVRKENFRDTSVHLLADVVVTGKQEKPDYKYYPDQGSAGVERSRFARFFLSSKQMIQGLNLGNFFTASPYQVSFTPGLSSHGLYNSQIIDHFSLNLLGGYTAGIDGFEMGGLFNINRKNVQYFQVAGVFNFVGGNAKGVQLAGLYNKVVNNAGGLQAAGLVNKTRNFTSGIQLAGLANINGRANGALHVAGLLNIYDEAKAVTIAGLANLGHNNSHVQVAGILNKTGGTSVFQLSGFMNVAKRVKGIQVGMVNIADTSDYAIGILNFIKNGEKSIAVSTDETMFMQVNFRSGGRILYTVLGAGYKPGTERMRYQLNLGIGAHLIDHPRFYFNTEFTTSIITDFKENHYQMNSLKALPGIKLNKHIKLFAGPSLNISSAEAGTDMPSTGWIIRKYGGNTNVNILSVGLSGGLQYAW